MKNILLSIILLCFALNIQAQDDRIRLDRYAEENKSLTKSPEVVFIGNSITENWVKLHPDFFKNNNFVGRGISGQTSDEILARFEQDVIGIKPKIVAILAGTNDIAENNGYVKTKDIVANIVKMCESAKENDITPLICSVLPCSKFVWNKSVKNAGKRIVKLNKKLKEYAEENGIIFIDYHTVTVDDNLGLPEKYSYDGCHPTGECYSIMEHKAVVAIGNVSMNDKSYYITPKGM